MDNGVIYGIITALIAILSMVIKWLMDELRQERADARDDRKVFVETVAALVAPVGIILTNTNATQEHVKEVQSIVDRIRLSLQRKSK